MTPVYLWPIATFIAILGYKRILLGYTNIYYELITDLLLLAVVFILSVKRRSKVIEWAQLIVASAIIVYQWLDVCVFLAIKSRLTLDSFLANYKNVDVFSFFLSFKLIVFTAIVLMIIILLNKRQIIIKKSNSATNLQSFLSIVFLVAAYFVVHNIIPSRNNATAIDLTNDSIFSLNFLPEQANKLYQEFPKIVQQVDNFLKGKQWITAPQTKASKPNIIIVLSESLSGVDSKYAGGLFDRLPMIDKMQHDGLVLKNMSSNGRITVHGLAALLLGIQTNKIYISGIRKYYPPKKFFERNLIAYAKKQGYHTIVISPGQPRSWFTQWLTEIGFDQVYDRDASVFRDTPRFTWDAPSDQSMYEFAEKIAKQQKGPYILLIETVSLHQPYVLPDPKDNISTTPLLNLIHYVDKTTYNFYEKLKKINYFSNGIIVLLGDHRRFEPLEKEEAANGGEAVWDERIVGSIVGKNIPEHFSSNIPFSTIDMNTLLHYIIDGQKVNEETLQKANLASQFGMNAPFKVTLLDDKHGTYLVRNNELPAFYVSIYGKIPFDKITNQPYKAATLYLMKNNEMIQKKLG